MTIQQALRQLEDAGAFRRAAAGDQRGASLFVRAAAYLANPTGDRGSWGWLSKSSGESNVDGFAEDALVLGADPNNLSNVYDFVGGTGAPGARVLYSASAVQRRPHNQWVAPRALSPAEAAYIGLGAGPVDPEPTDPPTTTPDYAAQLARIEAALAALQRQREEDRGLLQMLAALDPIVRATHDYARDGRGEISEIRAALKDIPDFPEYGGDVSLGGFLRGSVNLKPKG